MNAVRRHVDGTRLAQIVDLGCGTGRFTGGLADHFGAQVVGIDPSAKMLAVACTKTREGVAHVRAAAEAIPLRARSTDLVFMSMSFHHFDDPPRALGECARILRQGGWAVLRTGTRERIPRYPYTPFFPQTVPIMHEVLPEIPGVRRSFADAGLELSSMEIVEQTIAPDWNAYADKLAAGGDSVLARLREEELAEGIGRVREYAGDARGSPVVEPVDLLIFRRQ